MKRKNENVIIYGNSISAMILALELTKEIESIHLINPGLKWGGIFSGIKKNNEVFDIGMNLFEFSVLPKNYSNESKIKFDLNVRSTYRDRFQEVFNYFEKIIDLRQVDTPKVLFQNKLYNDYLISDKLNVLSSLSTSIKNRIKEELKNVINGVNKPKYHASFKSITPNLFLKKSYRDISILNHGKTFHELFIEKMVKKILNIDSSEIPALFHRISWCPLYYPETILGNLDGNQNDLPTNFHYPKNKNFNEIIEILFEKLKETDVKLSYQTPFDLDLINDRSEKNTSNFQFYYCGNFETYFKSQIELKEIKFEKTGFIQFYVKVLKNDLLSKFSVLFINDDDYPFFRITNMNNCSDQKKPKIKLVIEANYDFLVNKNPKLLEAEYNELVIRFLKAKNIIKKNALTTIDYQIFKRVILLPTFSNLKKYNSLMITDDFKNHERIGDTLNIFSNSLNEQVIQVFEIIKKWKEVRS